MTRRGAGYACRRTGTLCTGVKHRGEAQWGGMVVCVCVCVYEGGGDEQGLGWVGAGQERHSTEGYARPSGWPCVR